MKPLDGWDLGILIVVKRRNNVNQPAFFETINGDLVAEIGWLKKQDLKARIKNLEEKELLRSATYSVYEQEKCWFITEKGKNLVKGDDQKSTTKTIPRKKS